MGWWQQRDLDVFPYLAFPVNNKQSFFGQIFGSFCFSSVNSTNFLEKFAKFGMSQN
jgi:hypothetical protein